MVLYYLGLAACSFTNTFTGVKYGRGTNSIFSLATFSCITCTIATLFFLTLTGFQPQFNITTTLYALVFAAICLVSQYTGIAIYRYADIVGSDIVRGCATQLLNCFAAVWLFSETVTSVAALRVALKLAASVVVFLQMKHVNTRKTTLLGWLLSMVMVINGVASTAISKFYATDPRVVDDSSYFMLTNIFCLAVSLVIALISQRGNVAKCMAEIGAIRPKQYVYIVLNTFSSNLTSLLMLAVLGRGDLILYVPLSSAISFIATQIIAVVFEKEKLMVLPVLLSLGAIVLSFWG